MRRIEIKPHHDRITVIVKKPIYPGLRNNQLKESPPAEDFVVKASKKLSRQLKVVNVIQLGKIIFGDGEPIT